MINKEMMQIKKTRIEELGQKWKEIVPNKFKKIAKITIT